MKFFLSGLIMLSLALINPLFLSASDSPWLTETLEQHEDHEQNTIEEEFFLSLSSRFNQKTLSGDLYLDHHVFYQNPVLPAQIRPPKLLA